MSELRWGIDLGGTKIEGVVLDPLTPTKPLCRIRIDTEKENGYEHIFSQIKKLTDLMIKQVGKDPKYIGFGTPGALDPLTHTMKNCNTTSMNGRKMKHDIETKLKFPIKISNDANCFTLAEASFGAAKGSSCVFGVILGTGVGGGIAFNGKVHDGHQGIAGEWGHNVLIPDGPECYCGKRGCVEMIISGPKLEEYYAQRSGKRLKLSEIYKLSISGSDQSAATTIKHLTTNFGKAISVVINILDPDVIVLGGGVSNIDLLYSEGIEEVKKSIFNTRCETKIVRNQLGDSAGVFGAAML